MTIATHTIPTPDFSRTVETLVENSQPFLLARDGCRYLTIRAGGIQTLEWGHTPHLAFLSRLKKAMEGGRVKVAQLATQTTSGITYMLQCKTDGQSFFISLYLCYLRGFRSYLIKSISFLGLSRACKLEPTSQENWYRSCAAATPFSEEQVLKFISEFSSFFLCEESLKLRQTPQALRHALLLKDSNALLTCKRMTDFFEDDPNRIHAYRSVFISLLFRLQELRCWVERTGYYGAVSYYKSHLQTHNKRLINLYESHYLKHPEVEAYRQCPYFGNINKNNEIGWGPDQVNDFNYILLSEKGPGLAGLFSHATLGTIFSLKPLSEPSSKNSDFYLCIREEDGSVNFTLESASKAFYGEHFPTLLPFFKNTTSGSHSET